ncbi:ARM repeat-containing protein [Tuber magnatum]|uniref:V-type proton ATPase subunit H n=1 Tax=Tuber magnatum TaxID=42249 RepID=A0A317SV26_9PEZI|nr:ARM repeat-containing protein [Tuber magnatum]
MSLDSPRYLSELFLNIRGRSIAWDAHVRAGLITDSDVKKIKAIDKVPKEKQVSVVEKDVDGYAALVLGPEGALRKATDGKRVDVVAYMLVLLVDLLEGVPAFTDSLLSLPNPFAHLLLLLSHTDESTPLLSASVLTTLLTAYLKSSVKSSTNAHDAHDALPKLYHFFAGLTKSPDGHLQDIAIQSYVSLLRSTSARATFWDMEEETVAPIIKILETAAAGNGGGSGGVAGVTGGTGIVQGGVGLQLLYHVLLVIWELTFEELVAEEINPKYDVIPPITEILRSSLKEKITRLALATLTNLATESPSTNLPPLLLSNTLPYLQQLSSRFTSASDPDLTADLSSLIEALDSFQSSQTTLSSYRLEILSGHLRWSPPHRNEGFWKRHAREIMDDTELVKALSRVLSSSTDKTVLAVAANDVGVLIREVPGSRKKWEEQGVKSRVMELMGDSDAEVRYEALKAVQGFLANAFS